LRVPLPAGWRVLGPFLPPPLPPATDPETLCGEALAAPIEATPLAGRDLHGKRVLLVADDPSRPTPVYRFFRPVRDALVRAGAQLTDIEILFALGVHRPLSEAEARAKIGADNLAPHRWHNHNAFDPTQLVRLGTTARGTRVALNRLLVDFDLIVTLGAIEPHLLLGFSGGAKMLLPGCAAADTIGHNHLQGVADGRFNYVGALAQDSPMRLDLEEGVALLGPKIFIVNAALNAEGGIARFFCGHPEMAFAAGVDFVRRHAEVALPERADVVLANSRPFDADLRQGLKCIGNTLPAVRPGGVMLGCLHCADGRGDLPLAAWTLPYTAFRPLLRIIGRKRILGFMNRLWAREPIERKFLGHFGLQMLRRNHIWVFSDNLPADTGRRLGLLRQYTQLECMLAAAERRVGLRATVAVFPLGGATYARWTPLGVSR
jgi:nickel-dependent lactate racemase